MPSDATDIHRLTLMVQRLLDADLLLEAEAAALLGEAEAARRSQEAGDAEAVRRRIEQIVCVTEALVRSDALSALDGRAVMETARRILAQSE
jgi:hypothetical protein